MSPTSPRRWKDSPSWRLPEADHQRAVFLLGVSAANRTNFGVPIPTYVIPERDDTLERSHAALDEPAYDQAWERGQKASLSAVIESLVGVAVTRRPPGNHR